MVISRIAHEELEMVEDVIEETRNCFIWLFRKIKLIIYSKWNK